MKIYGIGFAPESSYVSNVIDLGASASLGEVVWSGSQDDVSEIDIAMRAGDDEDPNNYWRFTFRGDETARFDANGLPLVLKRYNRLDSERSGITHGENWDFNDGL